MILFQSVPPTKPIHSIHKAVPADAKPVTEEEARETFERVSDLFRKVNGKALGASSIPASDRPASRSEIIAEMTRIWRLAEPSIRFIPSAVLYSAKPFRIDPAQLGSLNNLVAGGFVGRVAPLAIGPNPTMTLQQFGDAVGFFVSRLAQVTHLPSPKWTPSLKED